jgi:hypothetical protein
MNGKLGYLLQTKLLHYPGMESLQDGQLCTRMLVLVIDAMQVCPREIRQGDHK